MRWAAARRLVAFSHGIRPGRPNERPGRIALRGPGWSLVPLLALAPAELARTPHHHHCDDRRCHGERAKEHPHFPHESPLTTILILLLPDTRHGRQQTD